MSDGLKNSRRDYLTMEELNAYLEGRLKGAEKERVEKLIASDELYADAVEGLRSVKDKKRIAPIVAALNAKVAEQTGMGKERSMGSNVYRYMAVAALLVVMVGSYFLIQNFNQQESTNSPVVQNSEQTEENGDTHTELDLNPEGDNDDNGISDEKLSNNGNGEASPESINELPPPPPPEIPELEVIEEEIVVEDAVEEPLAFEDAEWEFSPEQPVEDERADEITVKPAFGKNATPDQQQDREEYSGKIATTDVDVKEIENAPSTTSTTGSTYSWAPTEKAIEDGAISGWVVDAASQQPINGANVIVNGNVTTLSGADGSFTVPVQPGTYQLEFDAIGYYDEAATLKIGDGQVKNLEVELLSAGEIADVSITSGINDQGYATLEKVGEETSSEGLLELGVDNYNQGNYSQANFYLDDVLKKQPANDQARYYNGLALLNENKLNRSIQEFDYVINNQQSSQYYESAVWHKAQALIQKRKYTDAKPLLQNLIDNNSKYKDEAEEQIQQLD